MDTVRETMNIGNVSKGAVNEHFERALAKVYENIDDINTKAQQKRTVTLKFVFSPSETREVGEIEFGCEVKLAGLKPVTSNFFLAKPASGKIRGYARDPKQDDLFAALADPPRERPQ